MLFEFGWAIGWAIVDAACVGGMVWAILCSVRLSGYYVPSDRITWVVATTIVVASLLQYF